MRRRSADPAGRADAGSGAFLWCGLAAALVFLGGLAAVPATTAAFTDRATVASGTLTSGTMTVPATPTVTQTTGTGATHVAWTASAVGTLGAVPTSYEVYRYAARTGGTGTLACTLTVAPGVPLACDDTARPGGAQHYAVRARFGAAWQQESARRAFTADRTAPTAVLTAPTDGSRGNANTLRRDVTDGCGRDVLVCGTAKDADGGTVTVSLQYVPTGPNQQARCWNGTAYVAAGGAGCTPLTATTEKAPGDLRWRLAGSVDTAYRDRGTYTVTVAVADEFANTTTLTSVVTIS